MTDKELADKVVALGVGEKIGDLYRIFYGGFGQDMLARHFVRDWRVAGALMEKFKPGMGDEDEQALIRTFKLAVDCTYRVDSLPRAIIEACVEALR